MKVFKNCLALSLIVTFVGVSACATSEEATKPDAEPTEPAPEPEEEPAAEPAPEPEEEPAPEPKKMMMVEGHVTITDDHLEIDDVIKFETGSAKLAKESSELLDDIVKVMKGHSEIAVLHVIGHTDATGDKAKNVKLSESRAKSVVDYLKKNGVAIILKLVYR